MLRSLLLLMAACLLAPASYALGAGAKDAAVRLYVATNGSDTWSGKLPARNRRGTDGPFATLERARDEVRRMRAAGPPPGPVAVEVRAGRYELPRPFELSAEDSGTEAAPVVYRAYGKEKVFLSGGREVKAWQPVKDPAVLARLDEGARGKVMQADLKAQGIADLETIRSRGAAMEVFFQDRAMALARWPNAGFARIVDVPDGQQADRITYDGDRPTRWAGEKDAWLHGYWFHDWSDSRQRIVGIDAGQRAITLGQPRHGYGYKKGQRYYALNLLSELDSPGEWYADREAGVLYFWPPANQERGMPAAVVSVLSTLIAMKDASFVTLRGLTLETTRRTAVTVTGGTGCQVVGCTVRNTGSCGVSVSGRANGVVGCDIHDTAESGITLDGGDRRTLTAAGNYADNNHIFDYARLERTYRPGVLVNGVGQRVSHNLIHDGPHNGILLGGNDHVVELNELHSVCYETGDVGAFYTGRRWDWQGNVVRHNYFHDILGPGNGGALGVYLDDCAAGFRITGNLFRNVPNAAAICGGRDTLVENNIFVDCRPAVHVDARGLNWMKATIADYMPRMLKEMPYQSPPWSTRYPLAANVLEDEPGAPKYSVVAHNVSFGGRWLDIEAAAKPYLTFRDNWTEGDPGFVDPARGNYQLKEDSPVYKTGFQRVPIEKMGLYADETRATWPVKHQLRPAPAPIPPAAIRTGPPPVYRVVRAPAAPRIDGTLDAGEWGSTSPAAAANAPGAPVGNAPGAPVGNAPGAPVGNAPGAPVMVVEQGIDGSKTAPRSLAWLLRDDTALLVAVDNAVRAKPALKIGRQWGSDDAVELAFDVAPPKAGGAAGQPVILLLRGFASGEFQSSDESGAPAAVVRRAAEGVTYKARVVDAVRWTAEFRIPFAALGIDPAKQPRLPFNLSVRKTAENLWQMWAGTGGNTWFVDKAGFIELAP